MLNSAMKPSSNQCSKKYLPTGRRFTIQEAILMFGEKKVNRALEGKNFKQLQSILATLKK